MKAVPSDEELKSYPVAPYAYVASKILAHAAGDKFVADRKPKWDLIRVVPGYLQGANELYTRAEQMQDDAVLGSNEGTMTTALGKKAGRPRITGQTFLEGMYLEPQALNEGFSLRYVQMLRRLMSML